jgi:xanthine dehydrogenase YagT iron-sulfur-binding subunit
MLNSARNAFFFRSYSENKAIKRTRKIDLSFLFSMGDNMGKHPDEKSCNCEKGLSRRSFFTSVGAGAVVLAAGPSLAAKSSSTIMEPDKTTPITLLINGRENRVLVEPRWSLLFVLREKLGLTGAKPGCERGECGACTVLMDDMPRYSCLTLAVEAEGIPITTLEGLMKGEELGHVQEAFLEHDAFQCGYCTPGQIMAVEGLLRKIPEPSFDLIRRGVSGNLCRCGAYNNIFAAAGRASELKKGGTK